MKAAAHKGPQKSGGGLPAPYSFVASLWPLLQELPIPTPTNVGRPFLFSDSYLKIISGNGGHRSSSVQCVVDQQADGSLHRKRRADRADAAVDPNASESQTLARRRRVQTPPGLKIFRLKLQNSEGAGTAFCSHRYESSPFLVVTSSNKLSAQTRADRVATCLAAIPEREHDHRRYVRKWNTGNSYEELYVYSDDLDFLAIDREATWCSRLVRGAERCGPQGARP